MLLIGHVCTIKSRILLQNLFSLAMFCKSDVVLGRYSKNKSVSSLETTIKCHIYPST